MMLAMMFTKDIILEIIFCGNSNSLALFHSLLRMS